MSPYSPDEEAAIADRIATFRYSPLDYVLFAFDWGSGDLAGHDGPDDWQCDILVELGKEIARTDREGGAIRIAVASGHGIGKSALIAWIILFFMSTQVDAQLIVTANTKTQLETKTWRELSKWLNRAINRHWFDRAATKLSHVEAPDTWFASAVPWSEENPEAFAGAGDIHSRTVFLFDEASRIADSIHESSEGALTRRGAAKIAFGNPTRNTGWFRECWRKFEGRWITRQIDSRTAKVSEKAILNEWIEDYGLDSDFVRVRVLGQFPRAGTFQFIPSDLVDAAVERRAEGYDEAPRVIGVDVARYGDDRTVFSRRQGSKLFPLEKVRGWDTVQVGRRVAQIIQEWEPHAVFVDGVGIGAGVVDYLRHTGFDVIDVIGSARPDDSSTYLNLRIECAARMKKWLETADIPNDAELYQDLIAPEYSFNARMQMLLEKKEDMKKRGLDSPDCFDSVAVTFASPAEVATYWDRGVAVNDDNFYTSEGRSAVTGY